MIDKKCIVGILAVTLAFTTVSSVSAATLNSTNDVRFLQTSLATSGPSISYKSTNEWGGGYQGICSELMGSKACGSKRK